MPHGLPRATEAPQPEQKRAMLAWRSHPIEQDADAYNAFILAAGSGRCNWRRTFHRRQHKKRDDPEVAPLLLWDDGA
jgi:hypothetical protein